MATLCSLHKPCSFSLGNDWLNILQNIFMDPIYNLCDIDSYMTTKGSPHQALFIQPCQQLIGYF